MVMPPTPFTSTVADASAKPTRYSRATPRFEVQEVPLVPPAVELGWLVLKKVVPDTAVALETTFSPAARMIFHPFSPSAFVPSTSTVHVASKTPVSLAAAPVAPGDPNLRILV